MKHRQIERCEIPRGSCLLRGAESTLLEIVAKFGDNIYFNDRFST